MGATAMTTISKEATDSLALDGARFCTVSDGNLAEKCHLASRLVGRIIEHGKAATLEGLCHAEQPPIYNVWNYGNALGEGGRTKLLPLWLKSCVEAVAILGGGCSLVATELAMRTVARKLAPTTIVGQGAKLAPTVIAGQGAKLAPTVIAGQGAKMSQSLRRLPGRAVPAHVGNPSQAVPGNMEGDQ